MSAEGMKVTVIGDSLIEALKKDGVNLDNRLGKNASAYIREVVSSMAESPTASKELYESLVAIIPFAGKFINDNHRVMQKARAALQRAEGEL